MATYERYQTLSSSEQYLYSPASPVWVNRCQISWDTQSSGRLLQCRMVNVSEKTLSAVYLRVHCRDTQGQDITTLHLVPVTGLFVPPGDIFGDDRVITLWPNRTAFVEVYAERVCFNDGTAWNEQEPMDYLAIPAPAPVKVQDLVYPQLALAAQNGNARNEFYFRQLKNVWQCTCGVPNGSMIRYCRHCGADRLWLEQNMDPDTIRMPRPAQLPAPKPAPEPEPEPAARPTPHVAAPLEKFDLSSYLSSEPMRTPSQQEEFPYIRTYPAQARYDGDDYEDVDETEEPPKKNRAGRIVAIVLAVLLFLGVGAWLAYQQFLGPYAKYQEAVTAENAGEFETAIELYEALGEYEDSPERILACRAKIALEQMNSGDYAAAYEVLKDLPDYQTYAADCLYSLGVLAYNRGDYDEAWSYVGRLQEEYPDYENLQQLHDYCCYEFGKQQLEKAEQASSGDEKRSCYVTAKDWFSQAGSYSNSSEMLKLCDYNMAALTLGEADSMGDPALYRQAVAEFSALGDYSDSQQRVKDCMYDYCVYVYDYTDQTVQEYLDQLIQQGYAGAQELYEDLTYVDATVEVLFDDGPMPAHLLLDELEHIRIRYAITGYSEGFMRILMVYTMPGEDSGSVILNDDGSREGYDLLYNLIDVRASEGGELRLQFYDADSGSGEKLYEVTIRVEAPEEETEAQSEDAEKEADSPATGDGG